MLPRHGQLIEGLEQPEVHLLRSVHDARAIDTYLQQTRRAVIVGAGCIGLELADVLR